MARTPTRVVITGIGLITPLGNSADAFWSALAGGRSGVRKLKSLPEDALPVSYGAEAWDFSGEIEDFGPLDKQTTRSVKKGLKVMCREIQMGVAAAQLALLDAALPTEKRDPDRTGVSFGSDYIMTVPEEFTLSVRNCLDAAGNFEFDRWAADGIPKVDPLWLLKYLPNMPASHIAIYNDLRGPNNSITLREAASNLAVAEAYTTMSRGRADVMIAGATGTRVHPLRSVHVVLQEEVAKSDEPPERLSRPFDKNRCGMILGEGAGAVILETLEHAQARGAKILGEVIGYGSSTVASMNGKGRPDVALENSMRQALQTSGLEPGQVGHIHAHGASTVAGDRYEAQAIANIFSGHQVPVTAAKSYMGNVGAGGGLIELVASILAMQNGKLPPILNYSTPDPDCPLEIARSEDVDPGTNVLNLSVSPQGQSSAVVVRKI